MMSAHSFANNGYATYTMSGLSLEPTLMLIMAAELNLFLAHYS